MPAHGFVTKPSKLFIIRVSFGGGGGGGAICPPLERSVPPLESARLKKLLEHNL